ncbi:MAG TPA: mechanosensitive ion channel family protein [Candidatus Binataceae bacterium]|nr:mechanosensitive ion channel family protein [Candidatus Binataceae bacterium]
MQINTALQTLTTAGVAFGLQILGAIAIWIIGRWLIRFSTHLIARSLSTQNIDATLVRYICSVVSVLLDIILVVAILGFFGVQTTTFAAVLAAAGVAIGMAWSGLLANFAAGIFLVMFRPFKTGDFVTVGGVTGTVQEIGLFVTTIDAPDNVRNIVGNNKIFADNIQNFSANRYRRVELLAQLAHPVPHGDAIRLLKEAIAKIPNVLTDPAPDVEILEFNLAGPVLAVRPYCNNRDYWQVYFDTNRTIRETFGQAAFPVPMQHYLVRRDA